LVKQRIERYFFKPNSIDRVIALLLLPLMLLYCLIMLIRFVSMRPRKMGMPIISVGNLTMGGSGKTPFTIAIASHREGVAVVLRGYGRTSSGTLVVSAWGEIACEVAQSGDEAMLLAQQLPHATVIVAHNRQEGIAKVLEMGAKVLFLDDGYSKHSIKKLDIILRESKRAYLPLCLPSGPYREPLWWGKKALIVEENRDFRRSVAIANPTQRMVLVTAIAKPWRLDEYLPDDVVAKHYFLDHHAFTYEELHALFIDEAATSLLVTQKDAVKMATFGIPLSIMELSLEIQPPVIEAIDNYIRSYDATKN